MTLVSRLMQDPMGPRRCLAGRDARREPQTNSRTIRKARNKADRPAKHRPEGFARKVPSCGVARLVEQNGRSTFVARLASEHCSCKRGAQRVLHQPARLWAAALESAPIRLDLTVHLLWTCHDRQDDRQDCNT